MKYLVLSFIVVLFTSVLLIAQPVPPQPEPVPITGIEYLLIGGGAYGIYRLKKSRNNKNEA